MTIVVPASICASLVSGTGQNVQIDTTSAATVKVTGDDGEVCFGGRTPANVALSSDNTYVVELFPVGYPRRTIQVARVVDGWRIGNLTIGGIVGGMVDGAMWGPEPSTINVSVETAVKEGIERAFFVVRSVNVEGLVTKMMLPLERPGSQ
jgi:hypothetical protein